MAARKDFLRHIVNRELAASKLPRQIVDDVRRMVGRAEDKYKFHAFGGKVENLAKYLRSQDFNDLVTLLKGVRVEKGEEPPIEVLKRILRAAREAYSDIPEVVAAIDEKLKELEGETAAKKSKTETLYEELKSLADKLGAEVSLAPDGKSVLVKRGDRLDARIVYNKDSDMYEIDYTVKGSTTAETLSAVKNIVKRLADIAAGRVS